MEYIIDDPVERWIDDWGVAILGNNLQNLKYVNIWNKLTFLVY